LHSDSGPNESDSQASRRFGGVCALAMIRTIRLILCLFLAGMIAAAQEPNLDSSRKPRRTGPGPWDQDVAVHRVAPGGVAERLAVFERAGVATIARLNDGRIIAAHQHFPADSDADFDKVAVHFSKDEGQTWTAPEVIQLTGLPEGMRFPFDPTLVPLPDGRVRLYFTSVRRGPRAGETAPAIYSAISKDGVHYEVEPGMRFGIDGRKVIDCAVVLHRGVFHLYAPDNGPAGLRERQDAELTGRAYHAVSEDGLKFKRLDDVQIEGRRHWLGCAQSDGEKITFYGTGGGIWTATSEDGASWVPTSPVPVRGADPGVIRNSDGSLLVIATTAPRPGTRPVGARR
jgi:hypothetical protein